MPRFRVPGSTTNLGHGFDCLGIALGLANTIAVEALPGTDVRTPGSGEPGLAGLVESVCAACREAWGHDLPGLSISVQGDVPIARGMGSSATILLGVTAACQALAQRPFDRDELVAIAAKLEGHPDNSAAACLGGFTIVGSVGLQLRCQRFDVPKELVAVVAIPPFEVKTSEARKILPQQLSRAESVLAMQRTALITAALASGSIEHLRDLFDDAWHERHRAALNPGLAEARDSARAAGAVGTILSGSGSTVLSFCHEGKAKAVRAAVHASYQKRSVNADVRVVPFDNAGITRLDK